MPLDVNDLVAFYSSPLGDVSRRLIGRVLRARWEDCTRLSILALGYLFPLTYLIWSLRYGPWAGPNPWQATGLEWRTTSPPPTHNFDHTPVMYEEAYDYANRPPAAVPQEVAHA